MPVRPAMNDWARKVKSSIANSPEYVYHRLFYMAEMRKTVGCLASLVLILSVPTVLVAQESAPKISFLRERISITTKSGVIGIAPGTRVYIVRRDADKITVKTSDQQFEVTEDQLTTDDKLADTLRQRDAAQQQALDNDAAEREARHQELVRKQQEQIGAEVDQRDNTDNNATNEKLEGIKKRRELLKIQLDRIHFEQKGLPPPNSSYPIHGRGYRPHVVIQTSPKAFELDKEAKEVERQLFDLDEQEKLLRLQPPTKSVPQPIPPQQTIPTSANRPLPKRDSDAPANEKPAAISAPRPEYPYEARSHHITGNGVVELTVDPATGAVTQARMAESIGSSILDDAALSAFRKWKFKPGSYSPDLRIPIAYTESGVSY